MTTASNKIALGLFHFNAHWGGEGRIGGRHCLESLGPFLRALNENSHWRVSLEMSGSGLESVAEAFPEQMEIIRRLIDRGQLELLSALYTPSLWIAFPRRDLEVAVEMNRRALDRLRLPWTRIFFAQEAFFGAGACTLRKHFDAAVCKDDYLSQQIDFDPAQAYSVQGMRLIIASGHVLAEVLEQSSAGTLSLSSCGSLHKDRLHRSVEINRAEKFPARDTQYGAYRFHWYHCGDGHHFGSSVKPDDFENCYYDPAWSGVVLESIMQWVSRGYSFGTLSDLLRAQETACHIQLDTLLEGSWNPAGADGVFCWMGRNSSPGEDDHRVLVAISRARQRIVAAERAVAKGGLVDGDRRSRLSQAWTALLHAEISDSLGWFASGNAVQNACRLAEQALLAATRVLDSCGSHETLAYPSMVNDASGCDDFGLSLFGGEGSVERSEVIPGVYRYEVLFHPTGDRCGLRGHMTLDELVYCPTGLETSPVRIPMEAIKSESFTLPLANGLIQVTSKCFLIKDTSTVHVAVRVDRSSATIELAIEGATVPLRRYYWRVFLVASDLASAVRFANAINCADSSADAYQ